MCTNVHVGQKDTGDRLPSRLTRKLETRILQSIYQVVDQPEGSAQGQLKQFEVAVDRRSIATCNGLTPLDLSWVLAVWVGFRFLFFWSRFRSEFGFPSIDCFSCYIRRFSAPQFVILNLERGDLYRILGLAYLIEFYFLVHSFSNLNLWISL